VLSILNKSRGGLDGQGTLIVIGTTQVTGDSVFVSAGGHPTQNANLLEE